jgi:hypothetical protein
VAFEDIHRFLLLALLTGRWCRSDIDLAYIVHTI